MCARPEEECLAWAVPDLKAFLHGRWRIERSLLDRRRAIIGEMRGRADFTPAGPSLHYEERGTLTLGAHRGAAEQQYMYDFPYGPQRAFVRFRDGRPFHELDLSQGQTTLSHSCGADRYEGRFIALDRGRWQSEWAVTGPRKEQEILTLYFRLP